MYKRVNKKLQLTLITEYIIKQITRIIFTLLLLNTVIVIVLFMCDLYFLYHLLKLQTKNKAKTKISGF
jgi:hypothetical protein